MIYYFQFPNLAGNRALALRALRQAVSHMDDQLRQHALTDPDMASLRDDPEFRRLMGMESKGVG
jgi:hypothetical protein